MNGAAKFAVGGLTATALWDMLRPNYALAQQVAKDDKRIKADYTMYPSPKGNSRPSIIPPENSSASGPARGSGDSIGPAPVQER